MTEGNSKEFGMAVGTSTVLESEMMEGESFYAPIESVNETEVGTQTNWSGAKHDPGQLCRSCANTSDYLIPIYEGEGLEHQLEHKIQKHLPIQVSSTDTLPLQLCYQCASTLIAWDSLISSCLEAEKKLKAMQEAAEQEEQRNSEVYEDSHVEGDTEVIDSDDEPLITSKTKLLSEKNKASPIKKKILSKAKSKSESLKNEKTATNSKEDGDEEEEEEEEEEVVEEKEEEKEGEDKERSKILKKEKSNNNSEVMKKRKFPKEMESISVLSPNGSLKSIYRCKLCGHKTNRSNNLKTHLQIHKKVISYKCEQCGKRYQKRQDGKDHLNNIEIVFETVGKETKKLYRCKLCGHSSNRSNNLKKHLKSHKSTQEILCEQCGGKCKQSDVLNYHVKEIEVVPSLSGKGKKSFRCKICGETYNRMLNLRSHIISHKPINIYVCKICGKEYLGEKSLKEHSMNAHGKVMAATMANFPYKCEYCDQLFGEKSACEEHRQVHEGERPYICHICNCAFRTQSSLYLHSKVHSNLNGKL